MLTLKLLGRFELSGPDGRIAMASAKLNAFLAYLALAAKPVSREQLTALLWGSHFEEQARQNFRQALVRLKKIIGADVLVTDDQTVQLAPGKIDCDARRFEALTARGTVASLRQAAGLLEGDLLAGIDVREDAWDEWLSGERRRFGNLACLALEQLGRLELEQSRPAEALHLAEESIRRDLFREEAHRLALAALTGMGRRSEAIRHYQQFAERLKQELGTSPEAATVELYQGLLHSGGTAPAWSPLAELSRKPSLAVLPFANLSGDAGQDYFIDGVVDEIITALSRLHWLFVIARSSSFTYKGRAVDVKQVGRELGVRYVLEGSVRKAGNRLRINGQLVDAASGATLWADRFEGELADIFELQDMVTSQVVGAIAPKLEQAEIERSKNKPTGSLDAYDYYLRGQAEVQKWTREGNEAARAHFYKACSLDPQFSSAFGMAARCYSQSKAQGWIGDAAFESAEVRRLARQVVEIGPDDPVGLSAAGMALGYVAGDLDAGAAMLDRSIEISPNLAQAWFFGGWINAMQGKADAAISRLSHALVLSPHDPNISNMRRGIAFAYFIAGRYAEAISAAEFVSPLQQNAIFGLATVAASAALLGDQQKAEAAAAAMFRADPGLHLANLRERFPMKRDEDFARWQEGLRKAGLPA
jgi:TolB-like protein